MLDANPGRAKNQDESQSIVVKVLNTVKGVQLPISSRDDLLGQLEAAGIPKNLQLWLGSNLVPTGRGGEMTWAFNFPGCLEMFESLRGSGEACLPIPPRPFALQQALRVAPVIPANPQK